MPYSTLADMAERVGLRRVIVATDDEGALDADNITLEEVPAQVLERVKLVIEYADSLINSHISVRYKLPLAKVPTVLKTMSSEIAFYKLLSRNSPNIEEAWSEIHKSHLTLLSRIAEGKMALEGVVLSEQEKAEQAGDFAAGNEPLFTRDSLKNW